MVKEYSFEMECWVSADCHLPDNLSRGLKSIEESIEEHRNGLITEIQRLNRELRDTTSNVAKLKAENRALKGLLEQRAQAETLSNSQSARNSPSNHTISSSDREFGCRRAQIAFPEVKSKYSSYEELAEEYLRLFKSHENTKDQAGQYKAALKRYERRYEKNKLELARLRRYADGTATGDTYEESDLSKISSPWLYSNPRDELGNSRDLPKINTHVSIPNSSGNVPTSDGGKRHEPGTTLSEAGNQNSRAGVSQRKENMSTLASSQATETTFGGDEADCDTYAPTNETDVDSPVVVSSRIIKKRRAQDPLARIPAKAPCPMKENQGVGSFGNIKREELDTSSPIGLASFSYFQTNDNLDLDDISGHVETPRKRKRFRGKFQTGNFQGTESDGLEEESNGRAASLPPESSLSHQLVRNSFAEELSQHRNQHGEKANAKNRRYHNVKEENNEGEDIDVTVIVGERGLQELNEAGKQALKSLNVNRSSRHNESSEITALITDDSCESVNQAVASVAEDGIDYQRGQQSHHIDSGKMENSKGSRPQKRFGHISLECLLQIGPGERLKETDRAFSESERKSSPAAEVLHTPSASNSCESRIQQSQSEPPPTAARSQARKKLKTRRTNIDEILPEDEPLRARPLSRLNLEDFRINPAANNGHAFVFNEVIRGKEQRKHHLTACTEPNCCGGQFQKMLEIHGDAADSNSSGYGEEEMDLLREFLRREGGNGNHMSHSEKKDAAIQAERKLRRMSAREVQEALQKARLQRFAQRVGKHRQPVYRRAASPPGFWRTGMPSSQELEADRQASKRLEAQKIEERWREAMEPGGRGLWLFRDE